MLTRKALELLRFVAEGEPGACVLVLDHNLRVLVGSEGGMRLAAAEDGVLPAALGRAMQAALAGPRVADLPVTFACDLGGPHVVELRTTSTDASSLGFAHVLRIRGSAPDGSDLERSRWIAACDLLDGGVWDWDLAARRVWLSRRWKALLGHADDEIGTDEREWSSRIHPDDVGAMQAALQRHFDGRDAVYEHTFRLRHRDGRWIDYRGRGKVVARAADGAPARMVGIGYDVSAERSRQAASDRQAWVLRQALRVAHAGHWIWDAATDRHEVSPQFGALFGLSPGSLAGGIGQLAGLLEPRSFEAVVAARRRALENGEPYELELDARRADGTPMVLRSRAEPLREADGRVRSLLGVAVDITEQRRAESELGRRMALFDRMSELADVGAWEYDVAGGRLDWTRQTWRIHGLAPGDAPPVADAVRFYPGHAAGTIEALFARAVTEGEPYEVELPFVDAAGVARWVRTSGRAERIDGRCVRVFGAIQDITVAKRQALALEAAGRRLAQQNEDLNAFASVAAHDLKEPVRKVGSFLAMAQGLPAAGEPELAALLRRSAAAVGRLQALIDDILELARTGSRAVDLRRVDLDALLADVAGLLEGEVVAAGATLRRETLGVVEGDPRMLRQMLQNLLSNSLKFRHAGRAPEVVVRDATAGDADLLRLQVVDNGIGFEPSDAAQIMQPFRRLHGRARYDGTGIGLALVERIARRHHGAVAVEARPGEGACFTIELPRRQPAGAPIHPASGSIEANP